MSKIFEERCAGLLGEEIDAKEVKGYVDNLNAAQSAIEEVYTDFGHGHNPEWISEVLADMDETDTNYQGFLKNLEDAKREWPKVKGAFLKIWKAQEAVEEATEALRKLEQAGVQVQKKNAYLGVGR